MGSELIRSGGVVAFPTQCLYGLGVDAFNPDAVDRVFEIKKRSAKKPLLVLITEYADLAMLVANIPPAAHSIIKALWPGHVTLIFQANPALPVNLTAGTGKIGIRMARHPVARELVRAAGGPITATSANVSGTAGCARVPDIGPILTEKVDLVLDAGPLKGGAGSTIVDVTVNPPQILREGITASSKIHAILKTHG